MDGPVMTLKDQDNSAGTPDDQPIQTVRRPRCPKCGATAPKIRVYKTRPGVPTIRYYRCDCKKTFVVKVL